MQAKTYARIQLSKANEYYPGTTERTLLVTGRLKQVVAALGLIFAKLVREGVAPLRWVLARSQAGAGSGGAAQAAGKQSEAVGLKSCRRPALAGAAELAAPLPFPPLTSRLGR